MFARGVGWQRAGQVWGAAGRPGGAAGTLTAPAAKRRGFICFFSFLLPPLGARRRKQDKKLNRCQEGAAATRKWHSAPH